ncbi:MAG: PfkB family carbohydrate kinase [Saprospiraceae bacterium]|nr:HAD family hydrolase [Lewinella sp.]
MHTRIPEILEKIKNIQIAVYGDFCLDVYWTLDPEGSEISVETGRQAEAVARHYYSPGGAGNVAANVVALQPKRLQVIGVIGEDLHGRELERALDGLELDTSGIVRQVEHFDTYAFTKKYLEGEEITRTDFGVHNQRSAATDEQIIQHLRQALQQSDVLIFNQQIPGCLSRPEFISAVNELFDEFDEKIILLDSRHYTDQFRQVYLKLNEIEAARLNGEDISYQDYITLEKVEEHGKAIFQRTQKPVFITCGKRGIMAVDRQGVSKIPGIQLHSNLDTVGAGDTVLSALALALGAGVSSREAIEFANYAAAVSIQKVQTTGTAGGEEILAISRDANFIYQPELAQQPQRAAYLKDTDIEICEESVLTQTGHIKHAVFDHDGTISILREGWEKIMHPLMMKAILGDQYETADSGLYQVVSQHCTDYIDQSTGIQTIIQMEALVGMVDAFNIVPKDQILDKFGYKELYNIALLEMVDQRVAKIQRGELNVADVTIKGAVDLLHALKERGVRLYLASGTDREDVIREAELLGYASVFDGGIHGSVGDVSKYSKKMVIDQIMRENNLHGHELVVLGDGPVEIQEGRRFGGIAVGIACDEPRRYGLNLEKRTRLIRAGAHLIVPDFSQKDQLLELLFT